MNSLFSEIYSCYYSIITEIVNNAPVTTQEIRELIKKHGFSETHLFFFPLLDELPFLEKKDDTYYSLLENKIHLPLTQIEKAWIKAVSRDCRFPLFTDNTNSSLLADVEPLFQQEHFTSYDRFSDGDDFENPCYQKNFKAINNAIDKKTILKIWYQSPRQEQITLGDYLPIKFEFSNKDNKFRVITAKIIKNKIADYVLLNMARIVQTKDTHKTCEQNANFEQTIKKFNCDEPVVVEIYNQRNAIERFMIEFSTYKKQSEFHAETQTCKAKIYYRKMDELEVLIKLLSFGPTLKVLGPDRFVQLLLYRIQKQLAWNKLKKG